MGIEITQSSFNQDSYDLFRVKLHRNLDALAQLLHNKHFGKAQKGSCRLGAELELYIIDEKCQPLCVNQEILSAVKDPQLTLELNRYNLEYNLSPYPLEKQPFTALENEILTQLTKLNNVAKEYRGRVIPIGILPTLTPSHFGPDFLTDRLRYKTLVEQLVKRRGSDFHIDIDGDQPLRVDMEDGTLEGANTSFQIHYRVDPAAYANMFNAFQLITPLLVAIGGNSPGLFGHDLWSETRIPLFKQSIDSRIKDRYQWHEPARVNFGHGWIRHSALEIFREVVNIYSPLLPICSDEDPLDQCMRGEIPSLAELRLHQSSVWLWNRPVYDDADGGHLRVELRALPAGPTAVDMVSNAAFYIGLAESYRDEMPKLMSALPFGLAEFNFYRAAQSGLDANVVWPNSNQSGCQQQGIIDVLRQSVDRAMSGLLSIGIEKSEAEKYLSVIQARIDTTQTGASWQSKRIEHYRALHSNKESQRLMLEDYIAYSMSNIPVSEWSRI
jgi:gamma-glutamyl:cysteine ligase YbdK (ATP-grasp superfamily)